MTTGSRPVTLFTGQWADLPFEEVAGLAAEWGYDGLEIAASGDHLDLKRADEDDAYAKSRLEILDRHGLKVYAISSHLAEQAVCDDPIDFRHQAIVRDDVWGDGELVRRGQPSRRTSKPVSPVGVASVTRASRTRPQRGPRAIQPSTRSTCSSVPSTSASTLPS